MQEQPSLFPPAQRHSVTSLAAAARIAGYAKNLRAKVYAHLLSRGDDGSTDEETGRALNMKGSTVRPRRIELVREGKVRASGKQRRTEQGCMAECWVAVLPEAV